jgi:farnesyl-diphosphate farnesyltransferase
MLTLLLTHPDEFRILIQYWLYHEQKRDITAQQDHPTSGWDRQSMRRCWDFLDMTSRSFSAVIKELEGDLARTVCGCVLLVAYGRLSNFFGCGALIEHIPQICLYYLVLRGLDTIEDDMSIPDDIKQPLLRSFHEKIVTPGWTFDGNGPDEKDRQLLVEYNVLVDEVNLLKPE